MTRQAADRRAARSSRAGRQRSALLCTGALASALAGTLIGALGACASPPDQPTAQAPTPDPSAPAPAQAASPTCPATAQAPEIPPGTAPEHLQPAYWLERIGAAHDLDQVLMSPADIARLNESFEVRREGFHGQEDLLAPLDTERIHADLDQRMSWLRSQFDSGSYVTRAGRGWPTQIPSGATPSFQPRVHVALAQVPFYCAPTTEGFFVPNGNPNIDRNRCSTAHPQEPVRILSDWPGDMQLAHTRYTWGWIADDAALSPPLTDEQAARFVRGPFVTLSQPTSAEGVELPAGRLLPRPDPRAARVLAATARGVSQVAVPADRLRPAPRPLTRRAVIEEAFRYLGTPYGFGDKDGGRDCSRLLLDIFESFGIRMPRHSSWQARAGTYSIDLTGAGESDRLLLLDAAAARGIVLLHLPGHIMLYLGRDRDQRPMALHALGEYKTRCADDSGETLFFVQDVMVTDLELGRGTEKTALIERIDRIAVLGPAPDMELAGAAELRPAAAVSPPDECRDRNGARIFVSPARPDSSRPLRVIVTMDRDPGPAAIALVDPTGGRHMPPLVRLGGPPYGYVTTIEAPARGRWTAVFGDGDDVHACERIQVHSRPQNPRKAASSGDDEASPELDETADASPVAAGAGPAANPVWKIRREWTPAMEDLYAIFVERLFDYPLEEDVTWAGLHHLVRDRERNILHDHLGRNEDEVLTLIPDCADLPYTLRAYFAWKLGLPFGYRACGRARPGKPPRCEPAGDNLMSRSALTEGSLSERGPAGAGAGAGKARERLHPDVIAFARFVDRAVRRGVHSSSGRTHPDDDSTDFYPVPLTRRDLRPGTLFADPYGHLLILVDWLPQGAGRYGVLVGADAQPDGTVGRRRFWPGSFLFDPDTRSGGAGFKAFRPWQTDEQAAGRLVSPENRDLRDRRVAPFSKAQYEGSTEDFYDAMDALINPRPLDPRAMLVSLVDALAETVSRRVTSVQNGEDFMRTRGFAPIDMPNGADIFLTMGPWEDYATPSRDFRLLVSIDTVLGFPDAVARAPQRFGVRGGRDDVEAVVAELRRTLESELAARSFRYERSDRSQQTVTLAALVERQRELEIAYNPNDCPELRWGAPQGSAEVETCTRRAPAEQRTRMERFRTWFSARKRPAN